MNHVMLRKFFSTIFILISALNLSAQLVINEVNQGPGGNPPNEYIELLVVGTKTCTDSCANLQNWILDDNNGFFGSNGIAGGHIRFNSDPQWACVPYGTIIVVYNNLNPFPGIVKDETDANNDNVYFLPSNSPYFQGNTTLPGGGIPSTTYAGATYSNNGAVWDVLGMQNGNDVFQTVSPTNLTASYFSVGWGNCSGMDIAFTGSASGLLYQNANLVDNNPYTQGNWESQAESFGSPGMGNNAANIAWINTMRVPAANTSSTINQTICDGTIFVFDGINYTTTGTYTATFTTAAGCDSVVTLNLIVEICANCEMNLGADTLICGPINMTLNAGTFDQYLWQDGSSNPTFTVTGPGQYWCEASNFDTTNLVVNPGFESGNVNFSSDYTVGAGGNWGLLSNAGTYGISTSPSLLHNNFFNCSDQTSGTGNMMVVNGSNTANQSVWCQNIPVTPNTDYYFSIWAMSVENTDAGNVASLFFKVNNVQIGTNFNPSYTACDWQQYTQVWNSGTNTTANLCIFNHTITGNNYFAIDDIFFGELCRISDTINIANVTQQTVLDTVSICFNESATIFGQTQTVAGVYSDTLTASSGCDSVYFQTTLFVAAAPTSDTIIVCSSNPTSIGTVLNDTLFNATGCDSVYRYQTTVLATLDSSFTVSCTNIASQALATVDTFVNTFGCDSFYAYTTVKYLAPTSKTIIDSCTNISADAVNYTDTLFTSLGCDSVYQVYKITYIIPEVSNLPEITICFGESEFIFGEERNQTGVYESNIPSVKGCDSITVFQSLVVRALPQVYAGQDTTIDLGRIAILNASGADTYTWNNGLGGSSIEVSPSTTTTYVVVGTDEYNCEESDSVTVFILLEEIKLFVPTGFSPNGDGLNDVFRIVNENEFESISMRIYNRWGELVFINTISTSGWDGKYKNVDQPIENYIYYIDATAKKNQQKFSISGSISLIR